MQAAVKSPGGTGSHGQERESVGGTMLSFITYAGEIWP